MLVVEVVVRVQGRVAAVVERAAVELVGAAARDDRDDSARRLAIFCAVAVGQDLHFVDGLQGGVDENGAVGTDVVVVDAVDQEQVAGGVVAVDREVDAGFKAFVLGVEIFDRRDAGRQLGQLGEAAAVQRQFANLLPSTVLLSVPVAVSTWTVLASTVTSSVALPT